MQHELVVRQFGARLPTAALHLFGAVLGEQHNECRVNRRYFPEQLGSKAPIFSVRRWPCQRAAIDCPPVAMAQSYTA